MVHVARNSTDVTTLYVNSLAPIFAKPVFTLSSVILLNNKKSNWFYFYIKIEIIEFQKQLQCLVDQALRLFGEYISKSSSSELFLTRIS